MSTGSKTTTMTPTEQVLHWLCRDYETAEHWKSVGMIFYLASVKHPFGDADSEWARNQFGKHLQHVFEFLTPKFLHVRRWSKDFSGTESVAIPLPQTDPVKWEEVADYFLLPILESSPAIEEINSARKFHFMKQDSRIKANIQRAERYFSKMVEYMQSQGVSLPKKRLDGTVIDIRDRIKLVEEEEIRKQTKNKQDEKSPSSSVSAYHPINPEKTS